MTHNPFLDFLGVDEPTVEDGRARLHLEAADRHLNPSGSVHGGVLATLVDAAMGVAVRSGAGDGEVPATSQLTVTYLRPGKPGRLEATAAVRKQGEHLTVCEAEVTQEGRTLVHALATFAVLKPS
jgi:uncharacterized protein (TIGR00369 family)